MARFYYLEWPDTHVHSERAEREYISKDQLYTQAEEAKKSPGTHVFFLPRVNIIDEDPAFCRKLEELFFIDNFFLTRRGYKSNGFFRSNELAVTALDATCRTSATRFLVKEISEVSDAIEKDKLRDTLKIFQDKLLLASEELQSFSVPDDPAIRVAGEFLKSLKAKKDASKAKLYWLERHDNPASPESTWLAAFAPHVREFSRSPIPANIQNLSDSCDTQGSLLVEDETTANDFVSFVSETLSHHIHTGDCIIGSAQKAVSQTEDLVKGSVFNNATAIEKGVGKNRKHMAGYVQPVDEREPEHILAENKTDDGPIYMYHWLFLAFFTLTVTPKDTNKPPTQILLCFDNAQGKWMEDAIKRGDAENSASSSAYGFLPVVIEAAARVYDNALWGFRLPIRNIEKHRKDPINSMAQPRGSTADPGLDLTKSYSDMHELSRHIDHITEALRAAKSTMDAITVDCSIQFQASPGATDHNNGVRFWALFIANLEHRAVAFNDRLENEISLAYHLVSVLQLNQARDLLEESRDEGKDIARYVGYASMVFLPGTFVSGFFSMTFFGFNPDSRSWEQSRKIWVYFVVTVPLTIAGLIFIFLKHKKKETKRLNSSSQEKGSSGSNTS